MSATAEANGAGEQLQPRQTLATAAWDMEQVPALCGLSTLAAMVAMAINRIALPTLSSRAQHAFWLDVERWGDFATNLATLSGLFALGTGLLSFVLRADRVTLHRRLVISGFAAIFLSIAVLATVLERERTTTQLVLFAVGAANVLGATVAATAGRNARGNLWRALALCAGLLALLSLLAQVFQLTTRLQLSVWQVRSYEWLRGAGEVTYLLLLMLATLMAYPQGHGLRDRIARNGATLLMGVCAACLYLFSLNPSEFVVALYHAQRVTLLLDSVPLGYVPPLSMALALGSASLLGRDVLRRQVGLGLLLLIAAGYAPREPGRLVSMVLGLVLISRAVIAQAVRVESRRLGTDRSAGTGTRDAG